MSVSRPQNYPTDLTDAQCELFHPLIVLPTGGRHGTTDFRQIINAIFSLTSWG
ncbi:MAG: hypothetical protein LBT05_03980 [Planctomycetaceae bacterium]|nr:hypothetical protein [Planctomycetaceae bacterium]